MSTMQFDLSGQRAIVGIGLVVLFVGFRLATVGESHDPRLREAVKAELMNELGNQLGKALDSVDIAADPSAAGHLIGHANPDNIHVHSMRVSKPVMSMSSKDKTVVRVEYSLPGIDRRTEYWRFRHGMATGWSYRGSSSAVSYWLNFF